MRVFVAGATGALGTQLVPQLVAKGHEVVGMTRSPAKRDALQDAGRPAGRGRRARCARGGPGGGRGRARGHRAPAHGPLGGSTCGGSTARWRRPTACGPRAPTTCSPRGGRRGRAGSSRRATPAGRSPGRRAGQGRARSARPRAARGAARDARRDPPPRGGRDGDRLGRGPGAAYGGFYGPGTGVSGAPDADMAAAVRARRVPVVGDGGGVWSLVHIEDAAAATVAAVEGGAPGSTRWWTTSPPPCASGSRPSRGRCGPSAAPLPRWLGRLAAGEAATVVMTEVRGASNAKAKRERGGGCATRAGGGRLRRRPGVSAPPGEGSTRSCGRGRSPWPTRMLGSVGEAEDIVQEALLRLHRALRAGEPIASPPAWTAAVVTRLSIDELRSARARRERYVGEWLPEPLVEDAGADPAGQAELSDSLSLAFLAGAGAPVAGAARGVPAARRLRLSLRGDRRDRRDQRGQRPPARGAGAPPSRSSGRASMRRPSGARARPALHRRRAEGDLAGLEEAPRRGRRAPRRRRRGGALPRRPSAAGRGWRGPWWRGARRRAWAASRSPGVGRAAGAVLAERRGARSPSGPSTSPAGGSAR